MTFETLSDRHFNGRRAATTLVTAPMPSWTLTYFDTPSSRGEECRLALFLAGIPFNDDRLDRAKWMERKGSTPYGALPVLTVEGHPPLAQSNAILRLIGSQNGLHPTDPWEAARHESVMGAIEDMRVRLGPTGRIKDPEEKRRAREEFASGFFKDWAATVERQVEGPFIGGAAINVVDLKLFVGLTPFAQGKIDHVPADILKPHAKLTRLYEAVKAHPKVVSWYAR
jgi:glutathione S-transferase